MKKKSSAEKVCEPQTEYNLESLLPGGVQGKYVERYREGTNLILLEPDIARAFPTQEAVNNALRLVMQLSGIAKPSKVISASSPSKKRAA
ncbi:MAG: hypothetical protein HY888_10150 [Deltaproteobacteria bacterium]|nr:hypothetical protein [Deltaproteobacteria bacterium]